MKCANCGNEIPEGKLYCEKCGKAVQMVPDYDEFSNDIIPSMVARQEAKEFFSTTTFEKEPDPGKEQEIKKKKKKPYSKIVTAATLVSICICALIVFFAIRYTMSYEYTRNRASDAYQSGDYESAIALYLDAIALSEDGDNGELISSYLHIADSYKNLSKRPEAVSYYLKVLDVDSKNEDAFLSSPILWLKMRIMTVFHRFWIWL